MNNAKVQHPKVVVIGAGSLFFGRQAIWQMVHSPHLNTGTLALVDTDGERLEKMAKLAEMVIDDTGVSLALEASTERKDVLNESDFVVLSFADRSVHFRGIDCQIAEKYDVRMCSGDTIGPGGIFRAMREFPFILECAHDVESLCPDAWVINYINPTAVHGIGLQRYAPQLKSFALCDSLHMPHVKRRYAVRAGIVESEDDYTDAIAERFDMRIAGVNHFTWMLSVKERSSGKYQGKLKITKRGPSMVRRWLFFAAMRILQDPPVRSWFEAKKRKDGDRGLGAVVAVMRKLALALHAVGAHGEKFSRERLFPGRLFRQSKDRKCR